MSTTRTILLAWASADWPTLHPLMDAGRMPNLQRLVERGTIATVASAQPLTRETLATTLATGLHPDRHGVLGATQVRADQGGIETAGRRSWRAPAFWEAMAADGRRTISVNWPATAPADRWPGTHIDDSFATPSGARFDNWTVPPHSVSPADLTAGLSELRVHPNDDLRQELAAFLPPVPHTDDTDAVRLAILRTALARAATVHAVATALAARPEWELLCVAQEMPTDVRLAFGLADPGGRFDHIISQTFALLDMMLGRLVELAGDGATIVVVSPNGLRATPSASVETLPRGILVAAGPGIAADAMLPGVRLVDIAPTILARHGLSAPSDGEALERLSPPGPHRPARMPVCLAATPPDPIDDLIAEGYADPLTPAQQRAMTETEAEHLLHLGIALASRGQLADAADALEAALARRSGHVPTLRRLARTRIMMAQYDACLPLGQRLLAIDPALPWGHLVLATWAALGNTGADAEPYLVSARELGSDQPDVLTRIGGLELLRGNGAAAAGDFEAALALDAGNAEAAYGRALTLLATPGAEPALRHAIALEHNQPLAHLHLGALLANQGRLREAVATLETAQAQSPGSAEIGAALTKVRERLADALVGGWAEDEARSLPPSLLQGGAGGGFVDRENGIALA